MVRKRLIFLLFGAMILAGCGASSEAAPMENNMAQADEAGGEEALVGSSVYGLSPADAETEAAASKHPEDPGEGITFDGTSAETLPPSAAAEGDWVVSNYFVFTRDSAISTADDGTELLYEYTCDTSFYSMDPEQEAWVDSILVEIRREYVSNSENLLQYAQEQHLSGSEPNFYSYSNYQELGVGRHDSRLVSLMVLSSVYSGGAHPGTVQTAWNLDMENQKILTLEDVIYEEGARELANMVQLTIEDKFLDLGEGALFEDYADTIQSAFSYGSMTPYWYFNDTGLVIFFNQYELGPYAAGIIKAEVPYESLNGILREEYFPGNYGTIPGDLLLRGDWDGYRKIPITVEADGEHILIGVEGEVYQVQLSEVSWLEGTAIGQRMLFSASNLTQSDVLELIGGYDDESRSFAVEFTDGQGNTTVYYIHPEGLSEAP